MSLPPKNSVRWAEPWQAAVQVADDIAEIVIDIVAKASALRIDLSLQAQAGSDLQRTITGLEKRKLRLLERIPPDATMGATLTLSPALRERWIDALSSLAAARTADEKTRPEALAALRRFWSASNGELAVLLETRAGDHGAGLVSLVGTQNPSDMAAAVKQLMKAGDEHVDHQFSAYRVGKHEVHRVTIDASEKNNPKTSRWQPMLSYDMAVTSDTVIMIYGAGAEASMTRWLTTPAKTSQRPAAVVEPNARFGDAHRDAFMVAFASPAKALAAIRWPALAAISEAARRVTHSSTRAVLSAASRDQALLMRLHVPAAQFNELAALAAARP
jgi:hypothetical protein